MNKHSPLSEHISASGVETIILNYQDINDMLGLQLPKTAINYRAFWENPKNRRRIQNLIGLPSGYSCKVKLRERVVIFKREYEHYIVRNP